MGSNPTTFVSSDHGSHRSGSRERPQGAHRRWGSRHPSSRATVELPPRPPGQGVLGGRHCSDLRQHHASGRNDVRAGSARDRQRLHNLTDTANPGKQVVERVMLKEELRNVDGPTRFIPTARRGRGARPVPVRRRDAGAADRVLAVLRPARLPTEPRRPGPQREHARHVHRGRAGDPHRARRRDPSDRRRSDDRTPHERPRPQNARGKILTN